VAGSGTPQVDNGIGDAGRHADSSHLGVISTVGRRTPLERYVVVRVAKVTHDVRGMTVGRPTVSTGVAMAVKPGGTRVAIACQGGGSHTAFTAGVLQHLLKHANHEIVALSGTSGGAICALLTWYGLARSRVDAATLLEEFWNDNSATDPLSLLQNDTLVGLARLQDVVGLPTISPYDYPEFARQDLTTLLRRRVDFDEVAELQHNGDLPLLLVGAVDVRTGDHKLFSSRPFPDGKSSSARARRAGEITLEAILASAAVPPFFRAVHTENSWFWDGLFSQNPPVRDLVDIPDPRPEELWVIRINPRTRAKEPTTVAEIVDRRNELSGNLSLDQELYFIGKVNEWVSRGCLAEPYRTITVKEIPLRDDLDLASKLDRDPHLIKRLMEEGRLAAADFLA
jgi:NTE family protein